MRQEFWTKEEDDRLLVEWQRLRPEKRGRYRKGEGFIAQLAALFPTRSEDSINRRIALLRSGRVSYVWDRADYQAWTREDDSLLLAEHEKLPKRSNGALTRNGYQKLAALFPERSTESIYTRLKRLRKPKEKRFRLNYQEWTVEEVERLRELYSKDKFHLNIKAVFPNRKPANVVAKAIQLGISRARLAPIYFSLSEPEKALAAGLILGDGYVSLTQRNDRPDSWSCSVGFVNCEKVMVDWFVEKIPRGNFATDDQRHLVNDIPHRLVGYRWTLYDKPTIVIFLRQIVPYLMGKKEGIAKLILEKFGDSVPKET